jgi:hypothetical protein
MNKLYIFGDSFSTNFSTINEVSVEESWPVLLANKLEYELVSYASAGISNFGNLNKIYENLDIQSLDKNDMVIIGITFYDRLYDFWKNVGIDLRNNDTEGFTNVEVDFYKEKLLNTNGMMQYTQSSILQYNFIIDSLLKITTNVFFWNMDKCGLPLFNKMIIKNSKNYIKPFNFDCWIDYCNSNPEWWQKNNDRHFGKEGHNQFFQYLYQYTQNNLI